MTSANDPVEARLDRHAGRVRDLVTGLDPDEPGVDPEVEDNLVRLLKGGAPIWVPVRGRRDLDLVRSARDAGGDEGVGRSSPL